MRRALSDTNLGSVRHIVPVWCREIKQALHNLFKKSLLIVTTAAENKTKRIFYEAQTKFHIIVCNVTI